jgi:hypothetical protein
MVRDGAEEAPPHYEVSPLRLRRPHGVEELADFRLEPVAVARQRLRRGITVMLH